MWQALLRKLLQLGQNMLYGLAPMSQVYQWSVKDMRLLSGQQHLKAVTDLAREGQHVMIAPSHVKLVNSNVGTAVPWKNDWSSLNRMLTDFGLSYRTVLRFDADGGGETPAALRVYKRNSAFMRWILQRYIKNPVGLYLNHYCDPVQVKASVKRLYGSAREILPNQSMLIYPFGNWFLPGEETFKPEDVMADGGKAFESDKDRLKYDAGVKRGMAQLSIRFKVPVLPIYCTYKDKKWQFIVDEMIPVGTTQDSLELTHLWLARQAKMQAQIWGH